MVFGRCSGDIRVSSGLKCLTPPDLPLPSPLETTVYHTCQCGGIDTVSPFEDGKDYMVRYVVSIYIQYIYIKTTRFFSGVCNSYTVT